MSRQPSLERFPWCRPSHQGQSESHLLPQEHMSVTRVPVTPSMSTYGCPSGTVKPEQPERLSQRCFTQLLARTSSCLDIVVDQHQNSNVALSGNVLSATFTVPYALRYGKGRPWDLEYQQHRSAHVDALAYLSSDQTPWDHTVVGWTGEIGPISDLTPSSRDSIINSSACNSFGGESRDNGEMRTDEIIITCNDKTMLEKHLYNDHTKTIPIWLTDNGDITDEGIKLKRQSRWRRYAEHDICALFHYRQHPPADMRIEETRWADYYRMNEAFADKICHTYKPGNIVIVHDYYLMLLPQMLRKRCPDIYLFFFLESPFPTSELIRCLRRRKEILEGILGSDLVGFQSFDFVQHFANFCARILNYRSSSKGVDVPKARVHIGVFPTGIDVSRVTSLAYTDAVRKKCAELRKLYEGKKIIVGCDPLDRLGGVDKKIQAFGRFLDCHPHWRGKVLLVQITGPATIEDDCGDQSKYASRVSDLANTVNRRYGSLGFTPVKMHAQQISQDEYFALLRVADVALHTCVREGMSAMSLEYIACQGDSCGTLIIIEFSGTSCRLKEAIQINPWDIIDVANQINNALTMTLERRRHVHKTLFTRVAERDIGFWVNSTLQRLVEVIEPAQKWQETSRVD